MAFGSRSHSSMVSEMIDREVQEICRRWPMVYEEHEVRRMSCGRYQIDGRRVSVQVIVPEDERENTRDNDSTVSSPRRDRDDRGGPGDLQVDSDHIVVRDGPLIQPFLDYVFNTGRNERYVLPRSESEFRDCPLQQVDDRIEIRYEHGLPYDPGDRISAMHLARYEVQLRQEEVNNRLGLSRESTETSEEPLTRSFPKSHGLPDIRPISSDQCSSSTSILVERSSSDIKPPWSLAREPVKHSGSPRLGSPRKRPATVVVGQQVVDKPTMSEPLSEPPDEPHAASVNGRDTMTVTGVPWTDTEQKPQVYDNPTGTNEPEKRRHLYDDVILPENTGSLRFAPEEKWH